MQAIILCGGLGTRLKSVVSDRPKSMALINGRPFLELLIAKLKHIEISRFILATGYMSSFIENHFNGSNFSEFHIEFSREPQQLGTGGAIKFSEPLLEETFLVVNGDTFVDIPLKALQDLLLQNNAILSMVLKKVPDAQRYGTVKIDKNNRITQFMEKGIGTEGLINAGVYLCRKDIVSFIEPGRYVSLEQHVFPRLLPVGIFGLETQSSFVDIGIPEDYLTSQSMLGKEPDER